VAAYDLFLDESGQFTPDADRTQRFPSQLAGLLVPRGTLTPDVAEAVLRDAHQRAGLQMSREVHASELPQAAYDDVVRGVVDGISRHPTWQPVRLVNREGVDFGGRVSTYTCLVAELVVRLLTSLPRADVVSLRFIGATVWIDGQLGIDPDTYAARLREQLEFASIRLGRPRAQCRLEGVQLESGRLRRELQLCDVLSHASHADFRPCRHPETRAALRAAFGALDLTLALRPSTQRFDDALSEGALGLAARVCVERLVSGLANDAERADLLSRLGRVRDGLAALDGPARGPHEATLTSWVEDLIETRRQAELGRRVASVLLEHLALGDDSFEFALRRLRLTASNHLADLVAARQDSDALDALLPQLAGRWEHAPVFMEALLAQAVHLTDCFAHADAARRMSVVATGWGEIADLLSGALPHFPSRVRSELRGKALGTWLQAEMYAGLSDPAHLDVARALSDEALDEFADPAHVARQRQYRCQLETYAGRYTDARGALALALGTTGDHDAIGAAIKAMPDESRGFALLHWLRLGAVSARDADPEREAFRGAFKRHAALAKSVWMTSRMVAYPAHGIRRHLAAWHAANGDADEAHGMLTSLRNLGGDSVLVTVIGLAASIEVAALTWPDRRARALLDNRDKERPGVLNRLEELRRRKDAFAVQPLLDTWPEAIRAAMASAEPRTALLRVARAVGY
jgi:hypothetical protein